MPDTIRDGEGSGECAGVNSSHRLLVESQSRPSEEVEAEKGRGFILHGVCHTAASVSGGLMAFTNTSNDFEVVITRIYIDPQTLTPTDLLVNQEKNPTVSNGTDISTTGIVQKNFGDNATLPGVLTISDGSSDMTFSGGINYHEIAINSRTPQQRDMKGTNVVTPQTTIGWSFKREGGGSATDAEKISFSVNCFKRAVS